MPKPKKKPASATTPEAKTPDLCKLCGIEPQKTGSVLAVCEGCTPTSHALMDIMLGSLIGKFLRGAIAKNVPITVEVGSDAPKTVAPTKRKKSPKKTV